ncbi:MAG: hypothetical protein ACP5PB_07715 [Acidimicrobiales bacterium]
MSVTERTSDEHEADHETEAEADERLANREPERHIADPLDEFAPGVAAFPSGRVVEDVSTTATTDEDLSEEMNALDSVGDVADDLLDPRNPRHAQWLKDHGHSQ